MLRQNGSSLLMSLGCSRRLTRSSQSMFVSFDSISLISSRRIHTNSSSHNNNTTIANQYKTNRNTSLRSFHCQQYTSNAVFNKRVASSVTTLSSARHFAAGRGSKTPYKHRQSPTPNTSNNNHDDDDGDVEINDVDFPSHADAREAFLADDDIDEDAEEASLADQVLTPKTIKKIAKRKSVQRALEKKISIIDLLDANGKPAGRMPKLEAEELAKKRSYNLVFYSHEPLTYKLHPKDIELKNEEINVEELEVIDADGQNLGIMNTADALNRAQSLNMDLILTSSDPPEAIIESFGRYRYMKNKQRKQSTKTTTPKTKQVRFSCLSEEHDINTKLRRTEQFLREGRPVRVAAIFKRMRDFDHDTAVSTLEFIAEELEPFATADRNAMQEQSGRGVSMMFMPRSDIIEK